MPFKELQKEFRESAELRNCVLHGVQIHTFILGQLVACNVLHKAEERVARLLLTIRDRMESDTLYVTQECLASVQRVLFNAQEPDCPAFMPSKIFRQVLRVNSMVERALRGRWPLVASLAMP
jgi:hypothetical protein